MQNLKLSRLLRLLFSFSQAWPFDLQDHGPPSTGSKSKVFHLAIVPPMHEGRAERVDPVCLWNVWTLTMNFVKQKQFGWVLVCQVVPLFTLASVQADFFGHRTPVRSVSTRVDPC